MQGANAHALPGRTDELRRAAEVQPWLQELSDLCGESLLQAVICSDHPEIVDYLGGDKGGSCGEGSSGVTRADRIATVLNGSTSDEGLKLSALFARGWAG